MISGRRYFSGLGKQINMDINSYEDIMVVYDFTYLPLCLLIRKDDLENQLTIE